MQAGCLFFCLIGWWSACDGCEIELSRRNLNITTIEAALRNQLVDCPSPDVLLLNANNLTAFPENITYVPLSGQCSGKPLLVDEMNVSECQDLCTSNSNCTYVLAIDNNCSVYDATSCHQNNASGVQIHRKDKTLAFAENLSTLSRLELTSNQLEAFPSGLGRLGALTKLELSHNRISSLPANAFSGMTQLQMLNLQNNQLNELPPGVFQSLSRLLQLNLFGNQLTALRPNVFSGLSSLQVLILSTNRIQSLPANTLSGLSKLIALDFGANNIGALPSGLFRNLTSLGTLYFDNASVTTLPPDIFRGLTNLKDLQFCRNTFKELPPGIFAGLALNRIDMCSGELTEIPEETFWNLPLLTIRISSNKIKSLKPDTFQGLTDLRWLELQGNLLLTLPNDIFAGLTALSFLPLSDPPGCTNQIGDCTGVVKVGSRLQGFRVAPATASPTTPFPTAAPSTVAVLPPSTERVARATSSTFPDWGIGLIVLGIFLLLCCIILLVIFMIVKQRHLGAKSPNPPAPEPHETGQQVALIDRASPPSVPPYSSPSPPEKPVSIHYVAGPSLGTPTPPLYVSLKKNSPSGEYDAPLSHNDQSESLPVFTKGDFRYSAVRILGKGHFGTAYLVMGPELKVFVLKTIACNEPAEVIKEAKTLSINTPTSPHLLKILDFFFEKTNLFCLLTNYCRGGSLQEEITGNLEPHEIERILREIGAGLECLHAAKLVHRDLKPDNVYLDDPKSRMVVIGDMGMARTVDDAGYYKSRFGHMLYKAPEIEEKGNFSSRSDMWAVGCIGLELLSGVSMQERYIRRQICLGKYTDQHEIDAVLEQLPEESKKLNCYKMICGLLKYNPEDRLTATQLKDFPVAVGDYSDPALLAGNRVVSYSGSLSPALSPARSPISEVKSPPPPQVLYEANGHHHDNDSHSGRVSSKRSSGSSRIPHNDSDSIHGGDAFFDAAQLEKENQRSVHIEQPLVQPWDLAGFSYR